MTDSEIVKALECCGTTKGCCHDCPLNDIDDIRICQDELVTKAYRLISRQQTELKKAKSEAVREFAEKLKRKSELVAPSVWATPYRAVAVTDIDKIVEGMGCDNGDI